MLNLTRQEKLLVIFLVAFFLIGSATLYFKKTHSIDLEISSAHLLERDSLVNVNKAGEKELVALKGIGYVLARRIIEYRGKHGPFKAKEDLKKVKGIGPSKFEMIKEKISLEQAD